VHLSRNCDQRAAGRVTVTFSIVPLVWVDIAQRVNRLACPFRRFPFSDIYYISQDAELRIIAIAHQRRRPDYLVKRS